MTLSAKIERRISFETLDSTNKEAARQHAVGEQGPLWIVAAQQTAGRGRSGRPWTSADGNLAATRLFPFDGPPAEAPRLGFAVALAVGDTIAEMAPDLRVGLKWPNDVLLEDKKVSGILLESFGPNSDGTLAVAVGIGINLAGHPDPTQTRWPPTSIKMLARHAPTPGDSLDILSGFFRHWLERLKVDGFSKVLECWKERAAHLGQDITIETSAGVLSGRFVDLDADGALMLETAEGTRTFAAGDVTLGGAGHVARH